MEGTSARARVVIATALVGCVFGAAATSVHLADRLHSTAAWWPAAGIGVVALMVLPRRWWPGLLGSLVVAYAAANLVVGRDLLTSGLLGVFDTTETVVVAALVLRHVGPRVEQVKDLWRLFAISVLGALIAGLGIAGTIAWRLGRDFDGVLLRTIPSHSVSVMLLVPLLMLVRGRTPPRRFELVLQAVALAVVTFLTFGPGEHPRLGFVPVPILVWAALRLGGRVVAVEHVLFAVAVTASTWVGWGPFPVEPQPLGANGSSQLAQLYLLCIVMTGLSLVVAMYQRDAALDRLATSSKVFRRNFTRSRVAIALLEWDGSRLRFSETNNAAYAVLRRSSAELTGTPVDEVITGSEGLEEVARGMWSGAVEGWAGRVGVTTDPRMALDATMSPIQRLDDQSYFSLHLIDVTETVEFQERLQAEKDYSHAVIETAASMIVVTTPDGTITTVNRATTSLTGFTAAELVGRRLWEDIVPEENREAVREVFSSSQDLPMSGETLIRTKDGGRLAVVFSNSVYQPRPDAPRLYVMTAADVTAARENAGLVTHLLRSATTIAFIGTDLQGRITLFNTGAEQMLGMDAADATGRDFTTFLSEQDLSRLANRHPGSTAFAALVGSDEHANTPQTRDWTLTTADRTPRKASMTTNRVTDTFGHLIGYLFVARDVADTRRSQEILVRALRRERDVVAQLKELDRVKDEFVSTVSHELRTPMSSIIGSAEMLADGMLGEMTPEQRRMIDVIARNGDRLLLLADDLLLLAAMDNGILQQHHANTDLRTIARESVDALATVLAARDLELTVEVADQRVPVAADPGHLERAVTNLLANAVKFTPDGGRIALSVERSEDSRSAVLTVSDTGLGIAEDELPSVFNKFFRSRVVQERAIQGSGLGLPIVKTIVEDHDGRIDVRSQPGVGTTFTITLPLTLHPVDAGSPPRARP